MKPLDKLKALKPSLKTRGYLYRLGFAVGVLLVAEGVVTKEDFDLYEAVGAALLGLASANTPVRDVD